MTTVMSEPRKDMIGNTIIHSDMDILYDDIQKAIDSKKKCILVTEDNIVYVTHTDDYFLDNAIKTMDSFRASIKKGEIRCQ